MEDFEESPSKRGKERMEPGQLEDLILATSFTLKAYMKFPPAENFWFHSPV